MSYSRILITILTALSILVSIIGAIPVFAQNLPPTSNIQVEVLSQYSYKTMDGKTIVSGEVANHMDSPVNAVTIGVTFLDNNNKSIEYKTGTTLLQVILPGGKVPFSISSTSADPTITQIQVKLAGFRSSEDRAQSLAISPNSFQSSDKLNLSGTITNNGAQKSTNTKVYLISYDAFSRVVGIGISNPMDIDINQVTTFTITSDTNNKAQSYMVIAESDNYQSKLISMTPPTTPTPTPIPTPQPSPANSTIIPPTPSKIPNWIKAIFGYYAQGNLSDDDLIKALQFLIQQGIIKV